MAAPAVEYAGTVDDTLRAWSQHAVRFTVGPGEERQFDYDERDGLRMNAGIHAPPGILYVAEGQGAWQPDGERKVSFTAPAVLGYPNLFPREDVGCSVFAGRSGSPGARPAVRRFSVTATTELDMRLIPRTELQKSLDNALYPEVANHLRAAACRAGRDPYLALFQERASELQVFAAVQHPGPENRSFVLDIELRTHFFEKSGKKPHHDWQTLIAYGHVPHGIHLVIDGFLHAQVNLGDGDALRLKTIDVFRAPALVGEFERPLRPRLHRPEERLSADVGVERAIPAGAQIDITPYGMRRHQAVHTLFLSYEVLDQLCAIYPSVDVGLTAHSRRQVLAWLPLLGVGRNVEWRVIRWLLDEYERTQGAEITIPTYVFELKMSAGVKADTPKRGRETSRQSGRDILRGLAEQKLIELEWENKQRQLDVKILNFDGLRAGLTQLRRRRKPSGRSTAPRGSL